MFLWVIGGMCVSVVGEGDNRHVGPREWRQVISKGERASRNYIPIQMSTQPHAAQVWALISSASGMERGEVFYRPTDWLGSHDPMTHIRYTRGSSTGLAD
jgi:hypothetical protein